MEEDIVHDSAEIKRHFIEKLCNKLRKPTGQSGMMMSCRKHYVTLYVVLSKEQKRAQDLYFLIERKHDSCTHGASSDEDELDKDDYVPNEQSGDASGVTDHVLDTSTSSSTGIALESESTFSSPTLSTPMKRPRSSSFESNSSFASEKSKNVKVNHQRGSISSTLTAMVQIMQDSANAYKDSVAMQMKKNNDDQEKKFAEQQKMLADKQRKIEKKEKKIRKMMKELEEKLRTERTEHKGTY
jgi:hypothetical protein